MRKRGFLHKAEEIADSIREIRVALQSDIPLHNVLRDAKISKSTYYRWRKRYCNDSRFVNAVDTGAFPFRGPAPLPGPQAE